MMDVGIQIGHTLSDAICAICMRPAYKHILYDGKCHAIQVGDGMAVKL